MKSKTKVQRSTALKNRKMSELEFNEVEINKCSPDSQPRFGRDPVRMICSVCSQEMTTKVERKPSIYAWITGIVLFFCG